jgi:DNA repair exonuclease SbcCD ATPase subunit
MVAVTEEAQNCRRELEGKDSEIVALRAELVGREADIRDRDQEITRLRGMLPVHHPVIAERISPPVQHHRGVVTSEIVPEGVVAHPVSPDRQGSFVEGERVPQQPIQSRMLRRLSRMRIVPVPGSGTSNMKKKKKKQEKERKRQKVEDDIYIYIYIYMSSQLFERIETTTPNEITRNDLATYTIKSGDRQVPLDRLLTTQGKALEKQAEELFKKDDELEKFKEYLKEEKDANTLLKRRLKEINKNLEKYKSDLNTIDQEKQYVGNKNKELTSSVNSLTDEKKRLEAVVTGMSKKDENIKDIRDTYERSLQEHRNHITKLEKALESIEKHPKIIIVIL